MSKIVECTEREAGCQFTASEETEELALRTVAAHVKNEHETPITPQLVSRLRARIRDG